jgi:hypothetical protein
MAEECLALTKRALELRGAKGGAPVSGAVLGVPPSTSPNHSSAATHTSPLSDHLGPYAANLDDIEARVRAKFGFHLAESRMA